MEPDSLTVELYGVCINDGCPARELVSGGALGGKE